MYFLVYTLCLLCTVDSLYPFTFLIPGKYVIENAGKIFGKNLFSSLRGFIYSVVGGRDGTGMGPLYQLYFRSTIKA